MSEVLRHYGLQPDKYMRLRCPWHDDKTPSLQIFPKTESWTCFSSRCNAGSGDQIEFCAKMEGDKHKGITTARSLILDTAETIPSLSLAEMLPRKAVLSKVVAESKVNFKRVTAAVDYIKSRGLDPERTEVGYIGPQAGKSWNETLKQSGIRLGLLKKSRQNTLIPKFCYYVIFFLKDIEGYITGLYGRAVNNKREPRHLYLNGRHQGLYPRYPKKTTTKLILTESVIDCATLEQQETIAEQYGLLALYGTNGFTQEHEEAIKGLKELREIILFFDGDDAGRAATIKTADKLRRIRPGIDMTAVSVPEGEDVNSLIQSHEKEILIHLLQTRLPAGTERKTEEQEPEQHTDPNTFDASDPDKILYRSGELCFTIWGGIDLTQLHSLKINLLLHLKENHLKYYQDDVNLYSNGRLLRYIKEAAEELEISASLLKENIRELKEHIENYRLQQREVRQKALQPQRYRMSAEEEKEALALLKSKQPVKRTTEIISEIGLVGEQKNGLLLFFLYLTRLFDEPLHAIIFGKSGSGKTHLQTKIGECLPEESVRTVTALSENVLYYSPKGFWKHVVLIIEDLDGVYQALLALRELMSKQSITKYTTDKDAKGNNIQRELTVEGPVSVSGATTKEAVYEDNANRSFLLYVDESTNHLEQVMDYQRKLRAGLIDLSAREAGKQLLKNAQRLLDKNIKVYNPYAPELKLPSALFKPLRTNEHYLKLIDAIAFYHQKQREVKTHPQTKERYIEVSMKDIEIANGLIKESLLRKSDELNGELRSFFEYLKKYVSPKNNEAVFRAKDIRKEQRMHPMKLARYLIQLESRGYVKQTGGSRRSGYEYRITAWEEYETLQAGMHLPDRILEALKAKEKQKAN